MSENVRNEQKLYLYAALFVGFAARRWNGFAGRRSLSASITILFRHGSSFSVVSLRPNLRLWKERQWVIRGLSSRPDKAFRLSFGDQVHFFAAFCGTERW